MKLPVGSPYRMVIYPDVSDNGSRPWASRKGTLEKGDTETSELQVHRITNTNAAVTVGISTFTNIPDSHNGYTIVKDANLPIEVIPAVPQAPTPLPEVTAFLANYPNPFNPETWIPYQLAKPADVRLTIYDVRGVVIRTLALGHQPAGFYQTRERAAHWDGRNDLGEKVATGVYFCTFKAGDFTATRKMLIRK